MAKKKTRLDKGIELLSKSGSLDGKTILKNALPQKMSEVLLNFAAPLLDEIDVSDEKVLCATLKMATIVWNYAVAKDKPAINSSDKRVFELLKLTVTQAFSDPVGKEVLRTLLDRKKLLYPELMLKIADFNLNRDDASGEFHLTVVSVN
jgi:hypothetical protein